MDEQVRSPLSTLNQLVSGWYWQKDVPLIYINSQLTKLVHFGHFATLRAVATKPEFDIC